MSSSTAAEAAPRRRSGFVAAALLLLPLAACNVTTPPPGPQSVAGMSPVGTVQLHETFVSGATLGGGTLDFQGQTYPFRIFGTMVAGVGLDKIEAQGEVYNLTKVADFPGAYRQGTGSNGLNTASTSDLWLKNKAGVVLHVTGTQSGGMLSVGGDEVLIRMAQ
ncbi:MAG TPA: hypothetical protein VME92_13155 [Acetobacteraceae bacterium]|nr:hypothetical protein [Acetobacteraceae bacterium]